MSCLWFPSALQLNLQMGTLHPCLTSPVLWPLLMYSSTHLPVLWCPWRVTSTGPIACVVGCLQLLPVVAIPKGPVGKSVSQGGIQLSCLHCLYPKQMGKAQDEDFSGREMVPSQRVQGRDAASWEKGGGKTEPSVSLIFSENRSSESWILHSYSKSNFPGLSGVVKQNYQDDLK